MSGKGFTLPLPYQQKKHNEYTRTMKLEPLIDHTLLRPDCTRQEIVSLCEEAKKFGFKAVCVPPYFVKDAAAILEDTMVKVATVIGFPMGYASTISKVEEAKRSLEEGASEIDVVINICAVKDKAWAYVKNDIDSATRAAHLKGKIIKVIIETGLLNDDEIKKVCELCAEVEVDFVKTSTGFNGAGATVEVIQKLRKWLPKQIKIKASGGIRTREAALALVEAGADRLGTSAGLTIVVV